MLPNVSEGQLEKNIFKAQKDKEGQEDERLYQFFGQWTKNIFWTVNDPLLLDRPHVMHAELL